MNKVFLGDCLDVMPQLPDKSVDMILCDLPYGTTACKWDVIIPFEPLWKQYCRLIKNNGAIVLTASQPFTSLLVTSNLKMFRYEWIWDKGRGSNPLLANKQPMKAHENIVVFSINPTQYFPQMTEGTPYQVPRTGGNRTNSITGTTSDKKGFSQSTDSTKRFPLSIQKASIHCGSKLHPTQKPVKLFEYFIKTYTNEGETVLDNCAGSGTTAIACLRTNRQYICIEKDEKYYQLILNRIANFKPPLTNVEAAAKLNTLIGVGK